MTLRTGDVNADGVVNNTDLKEIRMEVGRGLVIDDNFRDDITVDGKVNHGDTTLEKKSNSPCESAHADRTIGARNRIDLNPASAAYATCCFHVAK